MVMRIWQKKCILTEFSQTKTKLITTANQTDDITGSPRGVRTRKLLRARKTRLTKSRLID